MNEKINNELLKIQDELSALEGAVKQIEKAETVASSVIKTINELQGKYSNHLDFIQKQVGDILEQTSGKANSLVDDLSEKYTQQLEEVSEIFEDYHKKTVSTQNQNNVLIRKTLEKTDSQIYQLSSSHNKQIEEVNSLLTNYLDLAQSTATLTEEVQKINFPKRLGNLENAAKQLNQVQVQLKDDFSSFDEKSDSILKNTKKTRRRTTTTMIIAFLTLITVLGIGLKVALDYWPTLLDFMK
jgi:chromosome segregation ATPase